MTGHVLHVAYTMPGTAEQVWDVLTDVRGRPDILRSVNAVTLESEKPYDAGLTWREERTFLGHHGTERMTVAECVPLRHTVIKTVAGRDAVRTSFAITPHADSVRISVTMAADMSRRSVGGRLGWALWGNLPLEATRKMFRHDLTDVEAEVARRGSRANVIPINEDSA
jgi:hypothetical protein